MEHLAPPLPPIVPLPDWMLDPKATPAQLPALRRANEQTMFEGIFERTMERLSCGQSLMSILDEDMRTPDMAKFVRWIMRDEARKAAYDEALKIGAEMVSHQIIKIADAADSIEDVQRSTIKINARKWLLGIWDRKRFGEVKQIDQTVTIDMAGAMEEARARAEARRGQVVDVQPREITS